jgi:hypothetical protein
VFGGCSSKKVTDFCGQHGITADVEVRGRTMVEKYIGLAASVSGPWFVVTVWGVFVPYCSSSTGSAASSTEAALLRIQIIEANAVL